MKKALSFALILAIVLTTLCISVSATESSWVKVNIEGTQFNGGVTVKDETTFVGIRKFATSMYSNAKVTYNYRTRTLTVQTDKLYLTATDGYNYIVANGRYLYTPSPIFMKSGVMYAPILLMTKAFGASARWENSTSSFRITKGSGGILSGDQFYRQDEVYWLSRIINAESGGEIFRGKLAVGSVILNRVKSQYFPNTIYGVIFDKKNGTQFSPTSNGTIYNSPSANSVIAAKICLEGYRVDSGILYFVNPSVVPNSWVSKYRPFYAQIGNHAFYY
ncbi:MAG: cell wall hydrolase [Clostridia bacterium]|nr:cell wall hydrolase [Clostridia bacterium]